MKKENRENPYATLDFTVKAPKKSKADAPKSSTVKAGGDLRGGKIK